MESLFIENQNLIKQYFKQREYLSPNTQKKYISYFKKFQTLLEDENNTSNVIGSNIETIIKIANREYTNKRMKSEYLKQFFLLLNRINKNIFLSDAIEKYSKLTNHHYTIKRQIDKMGIVSVPILFSLLKYSELTDNDYCLFFLLLNYGLDTDDLIINVKNDSGNYMYLQFQKKDKNKIASVKYILNNKKTITIKSQRFIDTIINHTEPKLFDFGEYENISDYINSRFNHYLNTDEYICEIFVYNLLVDYYIKHLKYTKLDKLKKTED
jgi:hypothetical protein